MGTYIIAEAGVNHNGSVERAKEMIEVAAKAGADAIKFQTFRAEHLVKRNAPKAAYQLEMTAQQESQFDMLKNLELDAAAHDLLIAYASVHQIEFLSSPFDFDSVDLLAKHCNLSHLKIPSGEITNAPLLLHIAQTDKPVILSTGMSTLGEIEFALGVLAYGYLHAMEKPCAASLSAAYASQKGQALLKEKVILLHCTTEYPVPFHEVHLKCMDTMKEAFQLPVGYSDHTRGIAVPIAAVARGAVVIEKHFTLDRSLPGPDHQASLEPGELIAMVNGIRQVEQAIGNPFKCAGESEVKNKKVVRRSLTVSRHIRKGEPFTSMNLTAKRPGTGIDPLYYWDWLGKRADREYQADEQIE